MTAPYIEQNLAPPSWLMPQSPGGYIAPENSTPETSPAAPAAPCFAKWSIPLLGTHCADTVLFAGFAVIVLLIGVAGVAL